MTDLVFKSTEAAFEYAKKFFGQPKLSRKSSYVGIVRFVDDTKEPTTYLVEITCRSGGIFRKQSTTAVAAVKHPELMSSISDSDLVIFGVEKLHQKIPTGYLLHKLKPEIDSETHSFKFYKEQKKYKVFVDDNFHYQDEDERYLHGEFDNLDIAINECKKIVDESLNYLMKNYSVDKLKEQYYGFGDSPFIEGNDFSSSQYAEEEINKIIATHRAIERGVKTWKHELDYKYGLLLAKSEMLEDQDFIHFCQTDRNKLCASWDIKNKTWKTNFERALLEGLSFTTPNRFESIVFSGNNEEESYRRKQYLIEYLSLGLSIGAIKDLTKKFDDGSEIEFSVDAATWNRMIIGNSVQIDRGYCKYFTANSGEEKICSFSMICEGWSVNLELFLEDDYGDQHQFSLKDFNSYYK